MKAGLAACFALLCAVVTGCGSGGGSSAAGDASAAAVVPATAPVFVSVTTDLSAAQLEAADAVLQKFPIRDEVLARIRAAIVKDGTDLRALTASVGPEVDVAFLDPTGQAYVGFTKPVDEQRFEQAIRSGKEQPVVEQIGGWTAFADTKASLDEVKKADAKLADEQDYKDATALLPPTAIAKAYAARSALTQGNHLPRRISTTGSSLGVDSARWASAALTAHDDGLELQVHAKGAAGVAGADNFTSSLAKEVPAGALAVLSFRDASKALGAAKAIPGVGSVGPLPALGGILQGEGILYVRAGNPIPEVTLLADESDPKQAEQALAKALAAFGPFAGTPRPLEVDGVKLTSVSLGPIDIVYGILDGKLIVSDDANAVGAIKGGGARLADDKTFRAAADAAGLPDSTQGWLYLNAKDALPIVTAIAKLSNNRLPPSVEDNLRPLRSVVGYSSRNGDTTTLKLFLQTN